METGTLDEFTRAYIECALWSSTVDPFGTCPQCKGENKVLCRWNKEQVHVCAECSETTPNYEPPADENYSVSDLAPETLARVVVDCRKFQTEQDSIIADAECSRGSGEYSKWEQAGHDFWLTRNGHGAGFWDGDWTEQAGEVLTRESKAYGEVNLYVGDTGKLYLS